MTAALAAASALAGCGGDGDPQARSDERPTRDPMGDSAGRSPQEAPEVERARCLPGVAGCRSAIGTILYVERVDPDGDGDAHFVIADQQSITAPGITIIDVAVDLRPKPLPGPGDVISGAGPVLPGSYGQQQIEADVVNTEGS